MTVFVNQAEYIGALSPTAGIRLAIHKQDKYPFLADEGYEVGVGQKASVKLRSVSILIYLKAEKNVLVYF